MKPRNNRSIGGKLLVLAMFVSAFAGCGGDDTESRDTSRVPKEVQVPTLAYDDSSITLVWKKPDSYANVADYNVYQDGKLIGGANANNTKFSVAKPYIDQFYKDDTADFHTKIQVHSYTVDGLKADTNYTFTVRALLKDGTESADSSVVTHKTAPAFSNVVDISKTVTAGDITDAAAISANTTAIQKAIDDCSAASTSAYGCKVLVPSGVYVAGALFLKSNMTLEIAKGATLKGSPNAVDYPLSKGYQLYSYQTNVTDDRRPPSLLNALNPAHMNGAVSARSGYDETRGVFQNIRVVGGGTIDGNGWSRGTDITSETGVKLAQYPAGSSSKWSTLGILAKSQMDAATVENGGTLDSTQNSNYYSNRRSSLTTFRGVKNMYFGGLNLLNPAYHGVMFLESQNVVFANNNTQTFDVNNGDGVEFGNSDGAMVFNNFFDTGDDCINFAAGQGKDYEKSNPTQNIYIFNNYTREGHGGVVMGSHTGAWMQDILAEDNVMYMTDSGLRMKSTPATGGGARRIVFRDNAMRSVGANKAVSTAGGINFTDGGGSGNAFVFTLSYSAGSNVFTNATASAQFRDVTVKNVTVDNVDASKGSAAITSDAYAGADTTLGYAETFHENIVFDTVSIKDAKATSISRMKNSTFKNMKVVVAGVAAPASWWVFKDTNPGSTFTDVSPLPSPLP